VHHEFTLDQGQQGLLNIQAGDVRFSTDHPGHLIHLVDTDSGVIHVEADGFRIGIITEDFPGTLFEAQEELAGINLAFFGGKGVGIEDDDHAILLEVGVFAVEPLHRPHDRGLGGAGVTDHHQVAEALSHEVLVNRHRHELEDLILADHIPAQGIIYFYRVHLLGISVAINSTIRSTPASSPSADRFIPGRPGGQ